MSAVPRRRAWRAPLVAVLQGAAVGAIVAIVGVALWSAVGPKSGLPSTIVPLPTAVAALPTATPVIRTEVPLVLGPDGIGFATFGDPGSHVVEMLTGTLGLPNEDAAIPCPGSNGDARSVRWADLTLFLQDDQVAGYIDGSHYPNDAPPLELKTDAGIGLGSTRSELEAAYGDRLTFTDAPGIGTTEAVAYGVDGQALQGLIEGSGGDGVVITIRAGLGCFDEAP